MNRKPGMQGKHIPGGTLKHVGGRGGGGSTGAAAFSRGVTKQHLMRGARRQSGGVASRTQVSSPVRRIGKGG